VDSEVTSKSVEYDPSLLIAVVEDDDVVAATLADMLVTEGYRAHICRSASALKDLLRNSTVDMILLDIILPDGNGLAMAAQIRATTAVPIIILTGKSGEVDRIVGLEIGADDYVVKPFSVREVAARIRAVLRRTNNTVSAPREVKQGYTFGGWTLDIDLRRLYNPNGKDVPLTVNEFDLLQAIISSAGRILTRSQLIDITRRHGNDDVFDRTVDVLILRLRRKIETNPHVPQFIVTERGLGYRFNATVKRLNC
jgi:two-component system OmpR family response regulator